MMQKITRILVETEGMLGSEGSSTSAADLNRIANALERIAASLEKLTVESRDKAAPVNQNSETEMLSKESKIVQPSLPVKIITPIPTKKINSVITEKAKPTPVGLRPKVLERFLERKEALILLPKKQPFTSERDEILDKVAFHLGKNFIDCKEIYLSIKNNNKSDSIIYSLYGATSKKNTKVQKFCKLLETATLLEKYEYLGSPVFQIEFNLINIAKHNKNFIEGKWLERFLRQELQRVVFPLYPELGCELLPNVHIQFKKQVGKETVIIGTELDLLFSVGTQVFCIEAKTNARISELSEHLEKIEPLGLAKSNFLIVAAENSEEERQKLSLELKGAKIVGLDNFEAALTAMIKAACEPTKEKAAFG